MPAIDVFTTFERALWAGLTFYYTVGTVGIALRIRKMLSGPELPRRLVRVYVTYLLLSVRLKPVAGECAQILGWTAAALLLWWLHGRIS